MRSSRRTACSEPQRPSDRADRSPRFATLYCPHCGAELDKVPTDRELAQDYACRHCGRHSRAFVHAGRCWYMVAL